MKKEKKDLRVRLARKKDWKKIYDIRIKVFEKEQKISKKLIFDGLDDKAKHFICFYKNKPIGTARILIEDKKARMGRLAVLKKFRKLGAGSKIVNYIIVYCKKYKFNELYFHSQYYIKDFYSKLGFQIRDKPFFEAGIKHIEMFMNLK